MKNINIVTYSRSPINAFFITGIVTLLPAPLIIAGIYFSVNEGVLKRDLAFWQRAVSVAFPTLIILMTYLFIVHAYNFTSYKLTGEGLNYQGFLGQRFFHWDNIDSAITTYRKEEYSRTTKSWHGLKIMRISLKDETKYNCSLGGLRDADILPEIINKLAGTDMETIDNYLTDKGHTELNIGKNITKAFHIILLFIAIGTLAFLYYDSRAAGHAGLLARARTLLENGEKADKINTMIEKSIASKVLDDSGIEEAEKLKARLALNQGYIASSIVILSNTKPSISNRASKYFSGSLRLEENFTPLLTAAKYAKAGNYERAFAFLSETSQSMTYGYEMLQSAQLELIKGNTDNAIDILNYGASKEYIWPEVQLKCKALLKSLKNNHNPVVAAPGPTTKEIQKIRGTMIQSGLEKIRTTLYPAKKAQPLLNYIVSKLLDSGATKISYIYSATTKGYGIGIFGKGPSFKVALMKLIKNFLGENCAKDIKTIINSGGTGDIFFEMMTGEPHWFRIGRMGWKEESAQKCLSLLNSRALENDENTTEDDNSNESKNTAEIENTTKIENTSLYEGIPEYIAIKGDKDTKFTVTTGFSIKGGNPAIAESDAIGTAGSMNYGTIERETGKSNRAPWVSFSTYSFRIDEWIKRQKLEPAIARDHETFHEIINPQAFEEVMFRAGYLKSSLIFKVNCDIKHIDFTKANDNKDKNGIDKNKEKLPEYDPKKPPPWTDMDRVNEAIFRMWLNKSSFRYPKEITENISLKKWKLNPALPFAKAMFPTGPVTGQVLINCKTPTGEKAIVDVQLIWHSKERNYEGSLGFIKAQSVEIYSTGNTCAQYSYRNNGKFFSRHQVTSCQ